MTAKHLAGIVLLTATSIGAAATAAPSAGGDPAPVAVPAVAVQRVPLPDAGLRDEAAMVLVGAALIALGAVVRRAG